MRKIIEGNVDLRWLYLTELFDLSDVEVEGIFNCSRNTLSNLRGSPHTVGGNYFCHDNILTSLKGSPHTVGGNFNCSNNKLTNLIGSPHTVIGGFFCYDNPLTSLEGIPKTIGGHFWMSTQLSDKFSREYICSLSNIRLGVIYL